MTNNKPRILGQPLKQQEVASRGSVEINTERQIVFEQALRWLRRQKTLHEAQQSFSTSGIDFDDFAVQLITAYEARQKFSKEASLRRDAARILSKQKIDKIPKAERLFIQHHLASAEVLLSSGLSYTQISQYFLKKNKLKLSGSRIKKLVEDRKQNKAFS